MKIANITPGIMPIPPKGWGAIEKLIWELHCNYLKEGHESKIVYLDELQGDEDIVHIHVGNLANLAHERGIPYYFTMSDHHAFLYGNEHHIYKTNYEGMKHAVRSFVGGKFLVDYFNGLPEYIPYGVNTDYFHLPVSRDITQHRLLCVANNGYQHDPTWDRKGFGFAIDAAKKLGLPITIAGPSNNKLYFENNPPNYDKLTILYDLTEEELLKAYHDHTIFLHPSELETGHPNLTLTEAMACGLPIVGTYEANNSLNGMVIVNRDADEVANGIRTVINNYSAYTNAARTQAEQLNWNNQAKKFLKIYEQDRAKIMTKKLVYKYNKIIPSKKINKPQITIHNVDGIFVEILNGPETKYDIKFIDRKTNAVVYQTTIGNNCWARAAFKYYVDWKVEIRDVNSQFKYEYNLSLENKRVYVCMESKSLGDTLAWLPYVEEFRKKHNCIVSCSTFLNSLFADQYPNIKFIEPGEVVHNLTALYRLGIFYDNDQISTAMHPSYPMDKPLQQIAADILGVAFKEIKPKIVQPIIEKDDKLITLAIHSTTQAKYWNNPTGWQDVVTHLKSHGYTVKLLSNEPDGYMGNKNPIGAEQHPASSLESVMAELKKSALFIGIGSGLSWLSWALNVPTMIISGFSDPISEMQDCIRISAPRGSCHGCFNRIKLNAGDWHWCPDHKNTPRHYECTKNISSKTVIDAIDKFLHPSNPRIQIKHLFARPTDAREILSSQSISQLKQRGFDYQPIMNVVYDGLPPAEHCRRPYDISNTPGKVDYDSGLGKLTGRHYGCYLAHRNALSMLDDSNFDYTLVFESDAYIAPQDMDEFVNTVYKACETIEKDNVYYISFANNPSGKMETVNDTFIETAHFQDLTHCYLVSNKHKQWWLDRIKDSEWDTADLWFNHVFCHHPQKRYTTQKKLCIQAEGMSLLDNIVK